MCHLIEIHACLSLLRNVTHLNGIAQTLDWKIWSRHCPQNQIHYELTCQTFLRLYICFHQCVYDENEFFSQKLVFSFIFLKHVDYQTFKTFPAIPQYYKLKWGTLYSEMRCLIHPISSSLSLNQKGISHIISTRKELKT